MTDKRSLLSKAKGAGSAKSGSHHWLLMKLTSLAMVPLIIWFAFVMIDLSQMNWAEQSVWLGYPPHTFLMIVFVTITAIHSANGFQTIIEDYVPSPFLKFASIYIFKAVTYLAGLAAILALLFLLFNR